MARQLVPRAALSEFDALRAAPGELFDVVVGNPPYFEVRGRPELRRKFASVIGGRANIFAMFVQAGLSLVKPGAARLRGPAVDEPRRLLRAAAAPHRRAGRDRIPADPGAQRSLRAGTAGGPAHRAAERWEWQAIPIPARDTAQIPARGAAQIPARRAARRWRRVDEPTDLFPESERLRRFFAGRKTLFELGYEAVTGSIVWNQHRDALRRAPVRGALPLVWAHNIGNGRVALDESHKRPQYIVGNRILGKRALRGPAIVVNRVTGSVGGGELRAALVEEGSDSSARTT